MIYLFLSIFLTLSSPAHDFHVSICQIEYRDKALQATLRVFTDDLEQALKRESLGLAIPLGGDNEHEDTDIKIKALLTKNFWVYQNGKRLKQVFIGKEVENELTYLYIEIPLKQTPETLEVGQTLFFDRFNDQSNIVNVNIGDRTKSAFLNKNQTSKILEFK